MTMRELLADNPQITDWSVHTDRDSNGQIWAATLYVQCFDGERVTDVVIALNQTEWQQVRVDPAPDARIISVARP